MEEKEFDKVTAFDTLFTTNRIQMYKVLLAYLPPSFQKTLAVYIKLSELYYTLTFFNRHPRASLCGSVFSARQDFSYGDSEGFSRLFDDISPYLSPEEQNHFTKIKNMMQSMKNMQEMMEMMEMMKSLFPEGTGNVPENFTGNFNGDSMGDFMGNFAGCSAESPTECSAESPSFVNNNFLSVLSALSGMGGMPNMPDINFDPSMLAQAMQMMNPTADSAAESATGSTADDGTISEKIN